MLNDLIGRLPSVPIRLISLEKLYRIFKYSCLILKTFHKKAGTIFEIIVHSFAFFGLKTNILCFGQLILALAKVIGSMILLDFVDNS